MNCLVASIQLFEHIRFLYLDIGDCSIKLNLAFVQIHRYSGYGLLLNVSAHNLYVSVYAVVELIWLNRISPRGIIVKLFS